MTLPPDAPPGLPRRIPVIGIVGGIGAGKSLVAEYLQSLGCVVSDSDTEAKAALDRTDVRARLVAWWGARILDADGRVDRAVLASIIFNDARERARLEQLVHPLVHEARERTIAEASSRGAKAVIVDAPLLFEAGVDKECDAVIFVDAPLTDRQKRVAMARGWPMEELTKREATQLQIEEKRRRSTHVLTNHGNLADLQRETGRLFAAILARHAPNTVLGTRNLADPPT